MTGAEWSRKMAVLLPHRELVEEVLLLVRKQERERILAIITVEHEQANKHGLSRAADYLEIVAEEIEELPEETWPNFNL